MTDGNLTAWVVYLCCSAVVLLALWVNTRSVGSAMVKYSLRATGTVLMLFPYSIGEDYSQLAPAIIMFFMEAVFEGEPQRVGVPMLMAWVSAMIVVVALTVWRQRQEQQRQAEQVLEKQRQELLDQSFESEPQL